MDLPVSLPLYGLADAAERTRELVAAGADGVFTFEGPHDVFAPLTVAATAGTRAHLFTNVAISFPRNAVHLAHAARDHQALAEGRFALGLGTQTKAHITKRFGVPFDRPVGRMADQVAALRAVFEAWETGAPIDHRSDFSTHTLMTPVFNPGPSPWGPPPIWVAALGPQMTRMAARVADGVLVMPFHSHRHWQTSTLPNIEAGLATAGRERSDLTVVAEAILCVGRDDEEMRVAEVGTRGLLSFYASTPAYRPVLEVEGWGDLQPELNAMSKQGRWDEMPALVPDEALDVISVRGTPAEVAAELSRRFEGVADRLAVYLPYGHGDDLLAEVLSAVFTT